MLRRVLALSLLALAAWSGLAGSQTFSARRMAMGGVILAGGGPGSDANNVAYRAVPPVPGAGWGMTLPLGLIQVLADPPELDPDQPDFNVFELANLAYNPPWNLQLVSPSTPANDISVAVGGDHLSVDLGDMRSIFPKDRSRVGSVVNGPAVGFGVRRFFLAAAPLVHYQNDLSFNDALFRAVQGQDFQPRTDYSMSDHGRAQAAVGAHLGWAGPLVSVGDPRGTGMGVYAGARLKLMRGLAYAQGDGGVSFTTHDTLFGGEPVEVGYTGRYYDAGPDGGGFGRGLDLGAVWLGGGFEVGLGVNDIGTTFDWRVRESVVRRDSVSGDYVTDVVAEDRALTSTVPATVSANAAAHLGRLTLAADVVHAVYSTTCHAGAETWLSNVALRAGAYLDPYRILQFTVGGGVRFGRLGLDLALATNSSNLSRDRGLELGAGVALYR